MKVKDINFNEISARELSIFVDGKEIACGSIGEVLKQIPHLKDCDIKETNYYFDSFVIRI